MPRLKNHLLARLQGIQQAAEDLQYTEADRDELQIEDNCLYSHATAQFNYTTYDVQRGHDVIKSTSDKCDIMLASMEDEESGEPFWYARVCGIYHARVHHTPSNAKRKRIPFLFVRWFGQEPGWKCGDRYSRLHRVGFVPFDVEESSGPAFGFVDPATVICACHLIPAFSQGKTEELLPVSRYRDLSGDYVNFYVNRCSS